MSPGGGQHLVGSVGHYHALRAAELRTPRHKAREWCKVEAENCGADVIEELVAFDVLYGSEEIVTLARKLRAGRKGGST